MLSGGGSDGSRGIRAVHESGGLVLVQDTESAQFDGMPTTARAAGVAQWVLRPDEMPRVIEEHARSGGVPKAPDAEPTGFERVYRMLQTEFGIDFTHYKPSTVTRRIERRLKLARAHDIDQYIERLRAEHAELDTLYHDLLIGVTRFFRNEEAFAMLEAKSSLSWQRPKRGASHFAFGRPAARRARKRTASRFCSTSSPSATRACR